MNANIQFSFFLRFTHMKYVFFTAFLFLVSCDKNSVERNPYLYEARFDQSINLALPAFDNLNYQGGSLYWPIGGLKGLLLFNLSGTIMAWEASCPNHAPNSCSTVQISGVTASCSCEDFQYSLATGQPLTEGATYSLLFYKVQQNGTAVRIYN
jgi:nitrite reductase/ring-hydroxylating ferredoxin subunit|tara:strand:- start:1137 stop:1595 length:459 start_codon:yes stop_codon:yes gene_type:complete